MEAGRQRRLLLWRFVFFFLCFFFSPPLFSVDYRRMMTAAQHNKRKKHTKKESLRLYKNRLTHCVQQRRQNNTRVVHSLVTHSTDVIGIGQHI